MPPMTKGTRVRITYEGRTALGSIILASPNGVALALEFDAVLGGYVRRMPVMRDAAGVYRDLLANKAVTLVVAP